jgi:branched-chain amino acid transport system substrate-binding protein
MKKLILWTLLIAMLVSMVGCASGATTATTKAASGTTAAGTTAAGTTAASTTASTNVIKIGLLVPLTGTQTQAGVEVQALAKLLEDAINVGIDVNLPIHDGKGLPNLGGAKVKIVVGDLSTVDIAAAEAERLITEQKVIGLAGNFSSASTKTAMVAAEKYKAILLSEGTSESLTAAGYKYFGRTYPGDDTFIKDSFEYIKTLNDTKGANIKNIALVCEDTEFGTNIGKTERKWAKEYGMNIVEDISYSATAANVTSEVLRLKKANADAVIMSSYIADALLYMSTFKEQNYFPKMLFGQRGGFASSDFIGKLGNDANFVFSTARWNTDFNSSVSKAMADLYKSKYSNGKTLIGDVLASAWDAYMIALIANQAGSTDPDKMRAEMKKGIVVNPDQDPTGLPGYVYGDNGQNTKTSAIVVQMKDKGMATVYPAKYASAAGIYPAPNWDKR